MRRAAASLLAGLCLLLPLASCGGGSSSATTSTADVGTASTAARGGTASPPRRPAKGVPEAPGQGTPPPLTRASSRRAERRAAARQAQRHRALARKAGRAAPFLVAAGDNSIPTYGSESSSAQRSQAEASLRAYLVAREAGDWEAACAQMTTKVQVQVAGPASAAAPGTAKDCAAAFASLAAKIPASARTNPLTGPLTVLRVEPPHAFALFYGPKHQQYMMPMEEEGGALKVTQLEPLPWPIGSAAQ